MLSSDMSVPPVSEESLLSKSELKLPQFATRISAKYVPSRGYKFSNKRLSPFAARFLNKAHRQSNKRHHHHEVG